MFRSRILHTIIHPRTTVHACTYLPISCPPIPTICTPMDPAHQRWCSTVCTHYTYMYIIWVHRYTLHVYRHTEPHAFRLSSHYPSKTNTFRPWIPHPPHQLIQTCWQSHPTGYHSLHMLWSTIVPPTSAAILTRTTYCIPTIAILTSS